MVIRPSLVMSKWFLKRIGDSPQAFQQKIGEQRGSLMK